MKLVEQAYILAAQGNDLCEEFIIGICKLLTEVRGSNDPSKKEELIAQINTKIQVLKLAVQVEQSQS